MCVVQASNDRGPWADMSLPIPELRVCAENRLQLLISTRTTHAAAEDAGAKCGLSYILDSSGSDVFGATVPNDIVSLAAEVTTQLPISLQALPRKVTIAFDVPYKGSHFVAIATVAAKRRGMPPFLGWQFLAAVFVSALTCLVLTRSLVDPIRRLQCCTEAFGRGDLAARPDEKLLKRKDELGELSNTIGQMASRIGALLSSQKNFLIQVSHELGSPLTRLNIALKLARRKADEVHAAAFDRIQHESSELNSMVQQLLQLARLESGLERDQEEIFPLNELVREVCDDAQFIASESAKQVHLLSYSELLMRGYRELLKRALDNVLRNAIRFAPEGSCVAVEILSHPNDRVLIQVTDHGTGVRRENLDAIFEPFIRDSSVSDRSGTGLGLAIARQAVRANGGTISAKNLSPVGFQIEISLPRLENCAEALELKTETPIRTA